MVRLVEEMTSDGTDDPRSEMMTGSNDQTNQARKQLMYGNAKYEVLGASRAFYRSELQNTESDQK